MNSFTKKKFLAEVRVNLGQQRPKYVGLAGASKWDNSFMTGAVATLANDPTTTVVWDGPAFHAAWARLGGTGVMALEALRALKE